MNVIEQIEKMDEVAECLIKLKVMLQQIESHLPISMREQIDYANKNIENIKSVKKSILEKATNGVTRSGSCRR